MNTISLKENDYHSTPLKESRVMNQQYIEYYFYQDFIKFKKDISSKKISFYYFIENIQKFNSQYENQFLSKLNQFTLSDLISLNPCLSISLKKYFLDYLILYNYNFSEKIKNPIYRILLIPKNYLEDNFIFMINKIFLFTNFQLFLNITDEYVYEMYSLNQLNLLFKIRNIFQKIYYPNSLLNEQNKYLLKELIGKIQNKEIYTSELFIQSYLFKNLILQIEDSKNREIFICLYFLCLKYKNNSNFLKNMMFVSFSQFFNVSIQNSSDSI